MRTVHHVIATRIGLIGRTTYTGLVIGREHAFVALPDPSAMHHTVALVIGSTLVHAPVLDLGPWYEDDPYWLAPADRPRAEQNTGQDLHGYTINGAGIDLSDGLLRLVGLDPRAWDNPRVLWWWS